MILPWFVTPDEKIQSRMIFHQIKTNEVIFETKKRKYIIIWLHKMYWE